MNTFLQAVIAVSGISITGLLAWQGLENDTRQTELIEKQTRLGTLTVFSETANAAIASCDRTLLIMLTDLASDLGETYADYLPSIADRVTNKCGQSDGVTGGNAVDKPVPAPTKPNDAPSVAQAPAAEDQARTAQAKAVQAKEEQVKSVAIENLNLRQSEKQLSELPVTQAADDVWWHAVLASYRGSEAKFAVEHYLELKPKVDAAGLNASFDVFFTPNSGHVALVLTPKSHQRDDARRLVTEARANGWAPDSFVQNNLISTQWKWIACPAPTAGAATLAQCASR